VVETNVSPWTLCVAFGCYDDKLPRDNDDDHDDDVCVQCV